MYYKETDFTYQVVIQTNPKPNTCYSSEAAFGILYENAFYLQYIWEISRGSTGRAFHLEIQWHSHTNKLENMFWLKQSNLYNTGATAAISAFSCSTLIMVHQLSSQFLPLRPVTLKHGSVILHRMDWMQDTALSYCAYFNKPAQH